MEKMYLGDNLFLESSEGGCLIITKERGNTPTNTIVVVPGLLPDLARYIEQHRLEMARGFDDGMG